VCIVLGILAKGMGALEVMAQDNEEQHRERKHDKGILIATLVTIREQMSIIVFHRQSLFRKEFQQYFPGPWRDVEERFNQAIIALETDQFNWEYVEGAGLVRDSLQFKSQMLTESIKQGVVGRTLKIINSILGSFAKVFPFLEAVKEYKEHIEAAISVQNRW
jgi:hypothetical protein